jgi:hypothetical protein
LATLPAPVFPWLPEFPWRQEFRSRLVFPLLPECRSVPAFPSQPVYRSVLETWTASVMVAPQSVPVSAG